MTILSLATLDKPGVRDNGPMSTPSISHRLAEAAVALFDENGYDETTVDDIAARAGVSRSTFFRYYRSKEDAIFPDHDTLLAQVDARLRASTADTAIVAVSDAVRIVLAHYVTDAEVSLRRYRLVGRVPALRDRENASVARYQRLFREFIGKWLAGTPDASLRQLVEQLQEAVAEGESLFRTGTVPLFEAEA